MFHSLTTDNLKNHRGEISNPMGSSNCNRDVISYFNTTDGLVQGYRMSQDKREVITSVVSGSNLGMTTLAGVVKYLLRTQILLKNIAHRV